MPNQFIRISSKMPNQFCMKIVSLILLKSPLLKCVTPSNVTAGMMHTNSIFAVLVSASLLFCYIYTYALYVSDDWVHWELFSIAESMTDQSSLGPKESHLWCWSRLTSNLSGVDLQHLSTQCKESMHCRHNNTHTDWRHFTSQTKGCSRWWCHSFFSFTNVTATVPG